jgi:hypothetical protein
MLNKRWIVLCIYCKSSSDASIAATTTLVASGRWAEVTISDKLVYYIQLAIFQLTSVPCNADVSVVKKAELFHVLRFQ